MGLLTHLSVIGQAALLAAAASSHTVTDPYLATLWNACPAPCTSSNPSDWPLYSDTRILKSCDQPMLLNLAVHSNADGAESRQPVFACTATNKTTSFENAKTRTAAASTKQFSPKNAKMQTASRGKDAAQYARHLEAAARLVQTQLDAANQNTSIIAVGYSGGVALGAYTGSMMDKSKDKSLVESFLSKLRSGELKTSGAMMQVCDSNRPAAYSLGVVSEASKDPVEALAAVKKTLATWNSGGCADGYTSTAEADIQVGEAKETFGAITGGNATNSHGHSSRGVNWHGHGGFTHSKRGHLTARSECRTIQVQEGNGCPSLAEACGITPAEFTEYNPDESLCGSLRAGQHVCCSAGTLPDFSPKPNDDGTCHEYTVQANDWCDSIAAANSLTTDDINSFNNNTWGWMGCDDLQTGSKICLSEGDPPMPAVLTNAVCGPQVAGTERPDNWDDISGLNPCPLNACCDVWGQCGTTDKFCTETESPTGAPGTAKANTNGCISNCGSDILYDDSGFSEFSGPLMVGYYEAFQKTRPCLNLDISAIEKEFVAGGYSTSWDHIHFAFANITKDFEVDVSAVQEEFKQFVNYPSLGRNPKTLSFGGWSFSTDLDSYAIFRKGVTDEQRSLFADNVVQFAEDHGLDGLDFDWEYPGAPDIPGIPQGDKGDGDRYLAFLKEVRGKLPSEKSLSIAAPSSYWYLKGFPIKEISEVVDYIVYMTYDYHGQWDYQNENSADECDGGSCLRSHVNYTETSNSLSMITKAGVPNSKIVAGLASYGRSFGMVDPSCHGPQCKFTGPESTAKAGRCTQTPGYIANAEIDEWLQSGENITTYYDQSSRSTISYSSNGTWVAYNTKSQRDDRIAGWQADKTVIGTSLWAIDLTEFVVELDNGQRLPPFEPVNCNQTFTSLDELEGTSGIDAYCMNIYLMQALNGNLTASLEKYNKILDDHYDSDFNWYKKAIHASAPKSLQDFLHHHASDYYTCHCMVNNPNTHEPMEGADNSTTSGCPYNAKEGGFSTCWWDPNEDDSQEKFEKDVLNQAGISPDWLLYGIDGSKCIYDPNLHTYQCSGSRNIGMPNLSPGYEISNPKDIISERLPNITNFQTQLDFIAMLSVENAYDGNTSDVVDGASMLAFMVSQSVTSMSQVAEIGEDYKDEYIKEIVILFVTALLLVIPGLGEVADTAGLAAVAATLRIVGEAGDIGMTVYDVVTSADAGPAAIFLSLLGGIGALDMIKAPEYFSHAAKARRGMKAEQIGALGHEVKGGMAQVEKMVARCF